MSTALAVAAEDRRLERRAELSFNDKILELMKRIEYRLPRCQSEREDIARLRHRCYVNEGAIDPQPSGMLWDHLDDLPNARVVGVYLDGELVASMRSHRVSAMDMSPGVQIYSDLFQPYLSQGIVVSDPTRFVVDFEVSRAEPLVAYATARIGWLTSEFFGARMGVATVRREHRAFYQRLLGFQLLGGPRRYPLLASDIWLVGRDYDGVLGHITARYPFMLTSSSELRTIFGTSCW